MRSLFLGALWAAASVSPSAQGSAFYPLNEGDTWTYEVFWRNPYPAYDAPINLRHVAAGADTTIAGELYRLLDVAYLDYAQTVTETARCAARVAGDAEVLVWVALRGTCGAFEADLQIQSGASAPATYHVGGIAYEGLVRPLTYRAELVAGLGAITSSQASVGMSPYRRNQLLRATVGGVTFGATPDPTAWHAFYPLAVGDRRVIRWVDRYRSGHLSTEVVGQETIDSVTYMQIVRTDYSAATVPVVTGTRTLLERYRDDLGHVVQRRPDGREVAVTPALGGRRTFVRTATTQVAGQALTARVLEVRNGSRPAATTGYFYRYVEGVGETFYEDWNTAGPSGGHFSNQNVLYAYVGGVGTGTAPAWVVSPVASEPGPGAARGLALRLAGSNPTAGPVRLRAETTAPREVRLTVTDVLGRTVYTRDVALGVGATDVRVDLGGHAAGLYRVRMVDATGAAAVVSVTVPARQ